MKKMIFAGAAIAAAATLMTSGSALAADPMPVVMPTTVVVVPPAPPPAWGGFFFGAFGGYAIGEAALIFNTRNEDGHFWDMSHRLSGLVAGVRAGFDHQAGSLVVGFGGTYTHAWVGGSRLNPQDGTNFIGIDGPVNGPPVEFTTTVASIVAAEARLGLALGDRLLIAGHGGVAFGRFTLSGQGGPANDFETQTVWEIGAVVGLSAELRVTNRLSIVGDVSRYMFPHADLYLIADGDDYKGAVNNQGRVLNVFSLGANIRF